MGTRAGEREAREEEGEEEGKRGREINRCLHWENVKYLVREAKSNTKHSVLAEQVDTT